MMQKIEKLVDELIGAAAEARTYYARLNGSELPVAGAVTEKPKRKKADAPAAPAPEPAFDPMMQGADVPAAPAAAAAPAAMTEVESTVKAQEANKALVEAFPTRQADKMPEGFHKAKALLSEFGVARTTDLIHTQRIAYIAKIDALIAARPA